LIPLSRQARKQIAALAHHYDARGRPAAFRNLLLALREASSMIERDPAGGLPAPRPYPQLAEPGQAWVKAGRYWIAYQTAPPPPTIVAVFYETANIPKRL
jgi:hypothetical protein